MMTQLKKIEDGFNEYCGPAVLSAITGKSVDECASVISAITGRDKIKGVEMSNLLKAFEKLRFDNEEVKVVSFSLFGVLTQLSRNDGIYVIAIPRHVIAVEIRASKIWLIDNHTKEPIHAEASARLHQKVDNVYKLISRGEIKEISRTIKVEPYYYKSFQVTETVECEDSRDNTKTVIGVLYSTDREKLKKIISELERMAQ